ncbi:MAG: serine/threonine-protein kinase [Pseudomonadota bacterium]
MSSASELPAQSIDAYLERECGNDLQLLTEAREMLGYVQSDASLQLTQEFRLSQMQPTDDTLPENIGDYRVVELLGRGGMGSVYLAEQTQPIRRQVALKVIRTGLLEPEVLARFDAERRALARFSHPGIAQIFEADRTADGVPFVAMEYVDGEPIDRYCQANQLALTDTLRLFQRVCMAVGHAHYQGVVHRDIKPANVLVTTIDAEPSVKVIDFGIAKFADEMDEQQAGLTRIGAMMGTPEFMSPEQASGAQYVDQRTDIYALGALLYCLITGRNPFDFSAASLLEVREQVLAQKFAPPSQYMRHAQVQRFTLVDLDNIVLKAMSVAPEERYHSAHALAEDVGNVLENRPVAATAPTWVDHATKFYRRHTLAVIGGVSMFGLIVLASIVSTVGFVQAEQQRLIAEQEARVAQETSDFVTTMLAAAQPENARGEAVTVRQILDVAVDSLEASENLLPQVEARIRRTLGESYSSLANFDTAMDLLSESLILTRASYGDDSLHVRGVMASISTVHWRRGDLRSALATSKELLALRAMAYGKHSELYAETLLNIGNAHSDLGEYVLAEGYLREALRIDRDMATNRQGLENLTFSLNGLATNLVDQGRFEEGLALHRESVDLRQELFGENSPAYTIGLFNLGNTQLAAGDFAAAENWFSKALPLANKIFGAEHPRTGAVRFALGISQIRLGKPQGDHNAALGMAAVRRSEGTDSLRYLAQRAALAEAQIEAGQKPNFFILLI